MVIISPPTVISEGPVSLQAPYWQQLTYDVVRNPTVVGGKIDITYTPEANDQAIIIHTVHAFAVTLSSGTNARLQLLDKDLNILMSQQFRTSSIHFETLHIRQPLVMPEDEAVTARLTEETGTNLASGTLVVWSAVIFRGDIIAHPTSTVSAT
jgi:hypothetical protein